MLPRCGRIFCEVLSASAPLRCWCSPYSAFSLPFLIFCIHYTKNFGHFPMNGRRGEKRWRSRPAFYHPPAECSHNLKYLLIIRYVFKYLKEIIQNFLGFQIIFRVFRYLNSICHTVLFYLEIFKYTQKKTVIAWFFELSLLSYRYQIEKGEMKMKRLFAAQSAQKNTQNHCVNCATPPRNILANFNNWFFSCYHRMWPPALTGLFLCAFGITKARFFVVPLGIDNNTAREGRRTISFRNFNSQ